MREQIEVLKHHSDLLPELVDRRLRRIDLPAFEQDLAGGRLLKQIQAAQERALAGAGRPDDENGFAVKNFSGNVIHRAKRTELLHQMVDPEHGSASVDRLIHCS